MLRNFGVASCDLAQGCHLRMYICSDEQNQDMDVMCVCVCVCSYVCFNMCEISPSTQLLKGWLRSCLCIVQGFGNPQKYFVVVFFFVLFLFISGK